MVVGLVWVGALALQMASAETGLEKELATGSGWRTAKWGMSPRELSQSLGGEFQEEKRSGKAKDAKISIRGKLKSKLALDGLEYEVKFGFNPADRLNSLVLVCEKAKKDSFTDVRQRLGELYGEIYAQERHYSMVGIKVEPYIWETFDWRQEARQIRFQSMEMKPNIFMTIRKLSVAVTVPDSEADFAVKGDYVFSGEVRQLRDRKAPRPCVLTVNPLKQSLKASCQKDQILDRIVMSEDRMRVGATSSLGTLEEREITVLIKGGADSVRLILGADAIEVLSKAFPKQVQFNPESQNSPPRRR